VPGHTAETYPQVTAAIAEQGHEIGHHGYCHENFAALDLPESRSVIRKGVEALKRVTGQSPRGFRAPGSELDGDLLEVLVEEGFSYDSSCYGEFELAWCRRKDTLRNDAANVHGERLNLVELPMCPIQSDFIYFEFVWANPSLPAGLRNARDVEAIWRDQLDYMCDRTPGGVFNLVLHPQSIGYGSRIAMLQRFLEYCADVRGLRFARCDEVAARFRAAEAGERSDATESPTTT
jgi:peptidoglycan/xylan/chitin deacetylase (PgdA/CDA1 family)